MENTRTRTIQSFIAVIILTPMRNTCTETNQNSATGISTKLKQNAHSSQSWKASQKDAITRLQFLHGKAREHAGLPSGDAAQVALSFRARKKLEHAPSHISFVHINDSSLSSVTDYKLIVGPGCPGQ